MKYSEFKQLVREEIETYTSKNSNINKEKPSKKKNCPICWEPLEDGVVKNMCVNDKCPTNLR